MIMYKFLNKLYGQLRGYERWRIHRQVWNSVLMSPQEIDALQDELFQKRVQDAIKRFPLYAEKVKTFRGKLPAEGERVEASELPIWTREDQNRLFDSLDGIPVADSFVHATGGSTGTPTRFYVTRESYEWRTAVSNYGYFLAGADEGQKSFYVWGTPIKNPTLLKRIKAGVHHWLQRRTYFDSFDFDDKQKLRCCVAINRVKPYSLVGYAGNLVELARFVRDNPGKLKWKSKTLITAAEGLRPGQRELLEKHLADEVFQSYGSREFMMIGMECWQHNGYHLLGTNLYTEVVDENGNPLPPGVAGRIVITDLRNMANPFIRYEIGDVGIMDNDIERCPCKLPFIRLRSVDGRIQEVIVRADGERLTALFIPHLMKEFGWIDGYQIVQNMSGDITVNIISTVKINDELTEPIAEVLRGKLGQDMQIGFMRVDKLQKSKSGKTPIVVGASGHLPR
jgi:phenylacetate-CoA ligase